MDTLPTNESPNRTRRSFQVSSALFFFLGTAPLVYCDENNFLPSEVRVDSATVAPQATKTVLPPTTPLRRFSPLKEPIIFKPLRDFGTKIQVSTPTAGNEKHLLLQYDLSRGERAECFAALKTNLAKCERVRLIFQGEGPANTLQILLTDEDGSTVGYSWPDGTNSPQWTATEVPLAEMRHSAGGDGFMDWTRVTTIQFNITKANGGQGGRGKVTLKEIKFF